MEYTSKNASGKVGIGVIITISLLSLGLLGAAGFGFWAYNERQDYKTNVNQKVAVAVADNTKKVQAADAKIYAEEAQFPLKTYNGPEAYGSVTLQYPKTWSAYNMSGSTSGTPVDFIAHPDVVPSLSSEDSSFALRMQVISQQYNAVAKQYNTKLKQGVITVKTYALPKNATIVGMRIDGQITEKKQGSVILIPLRDKTLKMWTESNSYVEQFDKIILENAQFTP